MQLLQPQALWLLGLVPVLILIHALRPKPRSIEVTNLFLWREALRERQGGLGLARFVRNLPLLLQILAVLLAALALARPVVARPAQVAQDAVLVLDAGASMKARGEGGRRFDLARQAALKLVDSLPRGRRMMVIEAGAGPAVRLPFSEDRRRIREAVQSIRPTDAPGGLKKALELALSFLDPERDDRVFLITDGADRSVEDLLKRHPRVQPVLVSGGRRNVGLTRFEVRPTPALGGEYEFMVEVMNFSPFPVLCPLLLEVDHETVAAPTVGLKPREKKRLFFPYSGPIAHTAAASLRLKDDFETDNQAWLVLNEAQDLWVLLVSQGNYFLETLLKAYPNLKVNAVREIASSSWREQAARHDVVILDRVSAPSTPPGNYLLIKALSPNVPISGREEVRRPRIVDWDEKSPLLSGLNLTGLSIESALRAQADPGLKPLVEARQTPLMFAYEKGNLRAVWLGFDLLRSDLPLKVAFPVLMGNILNWLHPDRFRVSAPHLQAGQPLTVRLLAGTKEFSIRRPSGRWEKQTASSNPFEYAATDEVGLYTVIEGESWRSFAVNLLDEAESDIRAAAYEGPREAGASDAGPAQGRAQTALWTLCLLLVALSLLAEWQAWLREG
jgi:hypothetical protein